MYTMLFQIAHDVAAGLAYLHPAVVHRDLKPHNVLLEGGPAGRAKVTDLSTVAGTCHMTAAGFQKAARSCAAASAAGKLCLRS